MFHTQNDDRAPLSETLAQIGGIFGLGAVGMWAALGSGDYSLLAIAAIAAVAIPLAAR